MFRRLIPRTVVGQLMAMLAIVLLIAQIINLALLVGEQRIQARSKAFNAAIEHSVQLIENLPEELPEALPHRLRNERGGMQGAFFLSKINRAEQRKDAKSLARYNLRFQSVLEGQGIDVLRTSVSFLADGPSQGGVNQGGLNQGGPNQYSQRRRPPQGRPDDRPPNGERLDEGRRSPPLPRREGRRRPPPEQDGLYHPKRDPNRVTPALEGFRKQNLQEIRLSAELEDGVWFNAMMPHYSTESLTGRIVLATAILLGLTLLAAWVFARRISRPLSEFTKAAERLGKGDDQTVLSETGPKDVRQAANAFNTMQGRLIRMLDTQRTMLRAVSHDLRTPLTSLRIRAENIPEELDRDKFISTLDDMSVMTEEILSWAKDASGTEALASVDLEAMLSSMTDDYQDQGRNVTLQDFKSMTVNIRRVSIKRALQNLINNALQYGQSAALSVDVNQGRVLIHIDDDGPGVPEAQLADILKPFVRLEVSRNKETGGTGLGLSIAETIAQIHGGRLILSNREPKGLRVTLSLPR